MYAMRERLRQFADCSFDSCVARPIQSGRSIPEILYVSSVTPSFLVIIFPDSSACKMRGRDKSGMDFSTA